MYVKLKPASPKWYELGLEFKLEAHSLDDIKNTNTNPNDCLRECIRLYLLTTSPSWKDIVKALKQNNIGYYALAEEIEEEIGEWCVFAQSHSMRQLILYQISL